MTRSERESLRANATSVVQRAIAKGALTDLKRVVVLCAHCGERRADRYDHRDYGKPLMVGAVCAACNYRLGSALPEIDNPNDVVVDQAPADLERYVATGLSLLEIGNKQRVTRERARQLLHRYGLHKRMEAAPDCAVSGEVSENCHPERTRTTTHGCSQLSYHRTALAAIRSPRCPRAT